MPTEPQFSAPHINPVRVAFLCLMLITTYALTHHYALAGDGELYALQAMARINVGLSTDVYLAGGSQDNFTFFSPLYALAIRGFGLWNAGIGLFAFCIISLLASAWSMAKALWNEGTAWLAVVMLIVAASNYGAFGVFQYTENYLTARSMAEALVVTSLAAHILEFRKLSWAIAVLSMLIHPIMALPGLLTLSCLSRPLRHSAFGAMLGIALSLAVVGIASTIHHAPGFLAIIRGQWLEMVHERSQFLFLNYWNFSDWEMHARVLLSLGLAAMSTQHTGERRLCGAAALVGVAGLAVALIAGTLGPVAILLQGQAWRWFWITAFVGVLVLAPTAIRLWKDGGSGSIAAGLLLASWTFPPVNGAYLAAGALCVWSTRKLVGEPTQKVLKLLALCVVATVIIWTAANVWSVCSTHPVTKSEEPLLIERLRSIWALQIPALILFSLALRWIQADSRPYKAMVAGSLLLVICIFAVPGTFKRIGTIGTNEEIEAFADWRDAIPTNSNVLLIPTRNSAAFMWFSLQRPSYLTVNQSAGIVFSEETSLEIRRRSEVLLPVEDPDWKLLSQGLQKAHGEKLANQYRPLTAESLVEICADQHLGFVVAKEFIGFNARTHRQPGDWKDWNLYDCGQIRGPVSGT